MADTTPLYGFPYQELSDAPNGPTLGALLAQAVEDELERVENQSIRRFADTAARDAALGAAPDGTYAHTDTATGEPLDVLWRRTGGAWEAVESSYLIYTPTWRNGTGGSVLNIGNGILTGRWRYSGGLIQGEIDMVRGSTTNIGTTFYTWELPKAPADVTLISGTCEVLDSPSTHLARMWCGIAGSEIVVVNQTGTPLSSSEIAWVAGDEIRVNFRYRL